MYVCIYVYYKYTPLQCNMAPQNPPFLEESAFGGHQEVGFTLFSQVFDGIEHPSHSQRDLLGRSLAWAP